MDPSDLLDLAPGTVLRGTAYRVHRQLGAGGMGAVYEGEHVRLRRRVCIKIIHPGLRGRDDFLQRMEIEAQTLARLDHPGIVRVFDLGVTDDGVPYFVMEYLEGTDLRRLLRARRAIALRDALTIMEEVLEALAHAHGEGVVHRDVKPENVFLSRSGADNVTKVLDFGIAHVADDRRNLTGERFLGTCQYAAPEQLQGKPPTEKTDVYAAGCMLFELVSGQRPFAGPSTPQFVLQHLQQPAPGLASVVAVPDALDAIVGAAMAKDPERRPTAIAFAAELRAIRESAPEASVVGMGMGASNDDALVAAVTPDLRTATPSPDGSSSLSALLEEVEQSVRDDALVRAAGDVDRVVTPAPTAPLVASQGEPARTPTTASTGAELRSYEARLVAPLWRRRAIVATPLLLGAIASALIVTLGRHGVDAPRAEPPQTSAPSASATLTTAPLAAPSASASSAAVATALPSAPPARGRGPRAVGRGAAPPVVSSAPRGNAPPAIPSATATPSPPNDDFMRSL